MIPTRSPLLSPLLFSQRAVREWCRLNFSAWYDHSLSHRAHGACHQNQCVFFFSFPWWTIQLLETRRIPTMCGNSSSILRGGWKALDTLGRKPLDPMFWSDNIRDWQSSPYAIVSITRNVWICLVIVADLWRSTSSQTATLMTLRHFYINITFALKYTFYSQLNVRTFNLKKNQHFVLPCFILFSFSSVPVLYETPLSHYLATKTLPRKDSALFINS